MNGKGYAMKRTGRLLSLLFPLVFLLIFAACDTTPPVPGGETDLPGTGEETAAPEPERLLLHTIAELNTSEGALDDHEGEQGHSSLELDFRSAVTLTTKHLQTSYAYYPRIKQLPNGKYILFYNTGLTGPDIYYTISDNLKSWSTPKFLACSTGTDYLYATADAIVLQNGDLLAVYSFRPRTGYTTDLSNSGLEIRRSTDNGKTWSAARRIYTGMNWEPFLFQNGDGTIYCIFTHTAPYVHYYGYNNTIRSSGSAIVRSTDNGATWTPEVTGAPYEAQRVIQDYVGDLDGRKIMNDQMPILLKLHNGTYMMACERQEIKKTFSIDLGYTDTLDYSLGLTEVGPADRLNKKFTGTGPYLAQFPSGETVITYNRGGFTAVIAGTNGKGFQSAQKPFAALTSTCHWQSTELLTSHSLLAAFENKKEAANEKDTKPTDLIYGILYLNHRVNAGKMTASADGNNAEWADNTDALFLGAVSQAQASFRFGYDDTTVSLLVERLDHTPDGEGDYEELYLAPAAKGAFYRVTVDASGVRSAVRVENGKETPVSLTGVSLAVTKENAADPSRLGRITELSLDRAALGLTGDTVYFNAVLYNKDGKTVSDPDTFDDCRAADPSTWKPVRLSAN